MSNETFDRIQAAIVLLLAVEFLWWVGSFPQQTRRRRRRKTWAWNLPAGAAVGVIVGEIVGGPGVCHPGTPMGALVGIIVGAAVSSWRRSRQERLFKRILTSLGLSAR
jgi:uncharacterized membrane protein YfcA